MRNYLLWLFSIMAAFTGCASPPEPQEPAATLDPKSTIGLLTSIAATQEIQVRGIGIVAGLAGTGSSECPANIRQQLEKYIWQQVPEKGGINPRAFIDSTDTAVVEIIGTVPYLSAKDFDVLVRPLSGTQTTSLDGGYLYTTDLKEISRLASVDQFTQYSQTLATASGPIYSNKLSAADKKVWYVMGGGKPAQKPKVLLTLNKPDYMVASAIRNRINERFGPKVCIPNSPADCTLSFPPRYRNEKLRFLEIVKSLLITDSDELRLGHITSAIERLINETDKVEPEIVLEGIGKPSLDHLLPLLTHPDESVRFHAARCMLNIGSNEAINCLRSMILNPDSTYRIDAIRAIGLALNNRDAKPLLMAALADDDLQLRVAAYEVLAQMDSPMIMRRIVGGGNFIVDSVVCGGPKLIYVYQQDTPRIALFGSPIQCSPNLFVQSDDGIVTINALAGDKYLSVSRKHPQRPRVIGPIKSSFDLGILLQTLGEMPEINERTGLRPGLAIAYADIVPLLKKMCEQNALSAAFVTGPMLNPESFFQNSMVSGR